MQNDAALVREQQRCWASQHGITIDAAGYTESLDGNLFQALSPDSHAEFEAGSGDELGGNGKRGKMQALHSSSALACNVFDYWRYRDTTPLSRALGLNEDVAAIRFEQKFPTGLPGTPPNLVSGP